MTTVFLSHSSADKPMVRKLARDLDELGVSVWLDERKIGVGDSIPAAIQSGLDASDYLALWITPSALASKWVLEEWQTKFVKQIEQGRTLVYPLLAGDVVLPSFLSHRKYADFRKSYMAGLSEFAKALDLLPELEESIAYRLHGDWEGCEDTGPVHFVAQGTKIRGSYRWKPLGTNGNLTGEIVGGKIVFQWFNGGHDGCALFELIGDSLVGSWWSSGTGPPFFALLNGADPPDETISHRWVIRRAK